MRRRRGLKYLLPTPPGAWAAVTLKVEAVDQADKKAIWILHEGEVRVNDGDSITFTVPVRRTDAGLVIDVKMTNA